jgi:hypothetical protein
MSRCRALVAATAVSIAACGHPAPPPLLSLAVQPASRLHGERPRPSETRLRETVVARARALHAGADLTTDGLEFPADPVGFVRAAFWQARIDLFDPRVAQDPKAGGVEILYRSAAIGSRLHRQSPRPGDLVFWDSDPRGVALIPTQVGVVETVAPNGTITALGHFAAGPARVHMNLRRDEESPAPAAAGSADTHAGNRPVPLARLFRSFADPYGP